MFSDYLFRIVNENLVSDTSIFPKLTEEELEHAIQYIKDQRPVETGTESIVARFLFAKTLKKLLEDPESKLALELESKPNLRRTLDNTFIESINEINKYFGKRILAQMPGPFIVPKISVFVGKREKILGQGTYGVVYSTTKGYAVKAILSGELDTTTLREVSILRYLDHPNIINLTNMQFEPPKIAMPLAEGTLKNKQLSLDQRKWIFYQLFRGLAYCHSKHVWHRDLKPENILLFDGSEEKIAKIADFGLAIPYARQRSNSTFVATLWWRAPELLLGDKQYSETIDIWSLGVMLIDSVTGKQIFTADDEDEQIIKILGVLGDPTGVWPRVTRLRAWRPELQNTPIDQWEEKISRRSGEKYYYNPISGESTFDKPYSVLLAELEPDEREVIEKTMAWPTQRSSALEILQLPYFNSVRDKVEIDIPAAPITIQSCGRLMLNEQQQATKLSESDYISEDRKQLFVWLWEVVSRYKLNVRTLFYALLLLDIYAGNTAIRRDKLQLYAITTLYIASELFEETTMLEYETLVYLAADTYTENEFINAVQEILSLQDFEIITPTCNDFFNEYIQDEDYTTKQRTQIRYYTFVLLLDYKLALEFTPAQIAQLAFEVLNLIPKCLQGVEPIYNQQIHDYIESFVVPRELMRYHQRYRV